MPGQEIAGAGVHWRHRATIIISVIITRLWQDASNPTMSLKAGMCADTKDGFENLTGRLTPVV
jgi:hypothetical protein